MRIIGPIRQEILSGISSKNTYLSLKEKIEPFVDLEIDKNDYIRAAEMYNVCRKNGIQGSHTDFLICAIAERYHLSIFTLDQDFVHYKKYIPILLYTISV